MFGRLSSALLWLLASGLALASPAPAPVPEPAPVLILDPVLNLLAQPPPKILRTTNPSPQCAAVNGGELQCCRAMIAGDVQLVVWLAKIYGYQLNPNDINGLNCDDELATCPGVKLCCQVTTLIFEPDAGSAAGMNASRPIQVTYPP